MIRENFWLPKSESDARLKEELDDVIEETEAVVKEQEYNHETLPRDLISTSDLFEKNGITLEDVYGWYASAISRRDREPLEQDRFVAHFENLSIEPTYAFGENEKGYLLGYLKYGVFVPTHFAPKTMRGGYELIKKLGESKNVPAVMSVTEDLSDTISKMDSWHILDLGFLAAFREELVSKKIVHNSHPDTKNLMFGLVSDYLDSAK